jgi:glycopeptide antibiotics resistance protein
VFINDNWRIRFVNIIGNIILFIPFGLIGSSMKYKSNTNKRLICFAMAFSFTLEAIQLIFAFGSFDVDDIILNSLGATIGIKTYNRVASLFKSRFRLGVASWRIK